MSLNPNSVIDFILDAQSLKGKNMEDSFAKIALQHAFKLY